MAQEQGDSEDEDGDKADDEEDVMKKMR